MRSTKLRLLACGAALSLLVAPGHAAPVPRQNRSAGSTPALYKNAAAPLEARVDDLLRRMTLEEKVVHDRLQLDPVKLRRAFPDGIGQFARPSDARGPVSPRQVPGRDARQTVELVNALQRYAVTQTRLGIPILFHEEGLHGYAALGATSFPQAIALASSWDPDLVRRLNAVTAREIRARGVHLALSPVVDIARDPRWGRIEETFGEDP